MTLATITTKAISDNIVAQIQASLNQTIPLLPISFTRVLAKALGGVVTLLYKYAGFIFLQMFVKTASYTDTEINGVIVNPLKEWGILIGVGDLVAGTQAELIVEITVQNQTGTLPSGTQLSAPSTGYTYITLESVVLNAATKQVTVRAVADQSGGGGIGVGGNLDAGATLSFTNPLANVARQVTVVSQSVTAADAESVDDYRQRIIDRFQKRPQGGAYADYELWSEGVAGIINAYPYTSTCPGQVDVYVEATPESSGSPDGIPTLAQLQAVLDAINYDIDGLASRRPAGALVNALAITRVGFVVSVFGVDVSDIASAQADIEAAIDGYLRDREPYIEGLSIAPRRDRITRGTIEGIIDDVVSAQEGIFTAATVFLDGSSVEVYTLSEGQKAKLESINFV